VQVLIADDDAVSRRLLEGSLKAWGYDVTAAPDGAAAWRLFERGEYPVVISDWVMPEVDGLALIRQIRASERPGYTYCILLTARSDKEDLVEGMEAGADDFMAKPFDRDELRVRLRAGERILRLEHTLEDQNRALREAQAANVNEEFAQSFTPLERLALQMTERVGSVGFFLLILAWSMAWLFWNMLAPRGLRFDPAPAFVLWLFLSNLIQITLMPLLLVGQNLQSRHAALRSESDYQVNVESRKRIDVMLRHLERLEARAGRQGELIMEILDRLHRSETRLREERRHGERERAASPRPLHAREFPEGELPGQG